MTQRSLTAEIIRLRTLHQISDVSVVESTQCVFLCFSSSALHRCRYVTHVYVFVFPQLEKKEMTPPFKPQITDDYGLENFDTQFTNEPVQLTPDDE